MACRRCIEKRNKILKVIGKICCFNCKKIQDLENEVCVRCEEPLEKEPESTGENE